MDPALKAFYEYHSALMEPWDGPAAMSFTDGVVIGAVLDRNGLRPSRYYVTKSGLVVMASEVGVLDIPAEDILLKERLHPGRLFLVDTVQGRIVSDEEVKRELAAAQPYGHWLAHHLVDIERDEPFRAARGVATRDQAIDPLGAFGEPVTHAPTSPTNSATLTTRATGRSVTASRGPTHRSTRTP